MWCPSASLALWGNAWLAGRAAPDDVLDALSLWAPRHSVTAYESAAAEATGLPWPDVDDAGAMSLLQTLRIAAGPRIGEPVLGLTLPVPGDARGLPAGSAFAADAMAVGEALLITPPGRTPIGLVPEFEYDDDADGDGPETLDPLLVWTAYSLPGAPPREAPGLGAAELELRAAVRTAAQALTTLRDGGAGVDIEDPRALVEQLLEAGGDHTAPDHAPARALRVLESAAQVDAIVTVGAGLTPIAITSSSGITMADEAMRPLSAVVRAARLAAVDAILQSAWRD
ncbi:hypothetical protein [Mycolicibacterium fallax]|uniref:Uncharacterized protein n=1 Tax=Mycolicibacterium fallax TaxID=1793 RepID=A0A1X1R7L5_MYCFA|nr:hypothetical protein [Mycolicibacterium fallax]ORV00835.1 hypothetical protein AWC04_15630 [Mycolicibacterium fallax]BBY97192.1 hypothetical protein MFAL_06590 [Mycolicibacterium fallax]